MKGWRTILLNVGAAVLPCLEAIDVTDVLGAQGMAVYGFVLTLANVGMRFLTTTPALKAK